MVIKGAEYIAKLVKETKDFHGLNNPIWQTKDVIRVVELEGETDHGLNVAKHFDELGENDLPCELIRISTRESGGKTTYCKAETVDGVIYEGLDNVYELLKTADIIGVSKSGDYTKDFDDMLVRTKAILLSSAGNEGDEGVTGRFKDIPCAIVTGAAYMHDGVVMPESYSAYATIDRYLSALHSWGEGTSYSDPVLMYICKCIKAKYPNFTQDNAFDVLKSISYDAGEVGFDERFGHGLPILPEDGIIPMLEEEEKMTFKDTKEHWAEEIIDRVSEAGLMEGFKDGTFKPDLAVTRAELATVLDRLDK